MLDQTDVDYVSSRLDHFASLYKADVSHRLHSLLKRHESDKQTISAQSAAIQHLQHSIEHLTEAAHTATLTSTTLASHHSALRGRCLVLLTRQHSHSTLTRCLLAWHYSAHQSAVTRHRASSHRRHALQRQWFLRWRAWTRAEKAARVDGYWRGEMKRVREEVQREREAEVVQLREEMKEMMITLRLHDRHHGDREERLRQAWMRGVCALNKEAMAAFGEEAAGGGEGGGGGRRGGGKGDERKEEGKEEKWTGDMSGSTVSSIAGVSSGSASMASSGLMGSLRSEGVVAFQPIPMRLSHPYPSVQVPVITRSVTGGGGGTREEWEGKGVRGSHTTSTLKGRSAVEESRGLRGTRAPMHSHTAKR